MSAQHAYVELISHLREIGTLDSISALLGWDEQTHLPPGGADHRANQSSYVARVRHEKFTSPRIGELLAEIESSSLIQNPESDTAANVRETRRDYDRATK